MNRVLLSRCWLSVTFDKIKVTEIKLLVLWQRRTLGKDLASHERLVKYFSPQPLSGKLPMKILTYYFFTHSCGVLALHRLRRILFTSAEITPQRRTNSRHDARFLLTYQSRFFIIFFSLPPTFYIIIVIIFIIQSVGSTQCAPEWGDGTFFMCFFFLNSQLPTTHNAWWWRE